MEQEYLPDYAKKIIDTNQFKRLKKVMQHGLITKLKPTVNVTRYDHCIGTCLKALKMLDALEKNTKRLEIPPFLKKCVAIAALLHDVGHGPFSHQWEYITDKKYNHEKNAGPIVDQIFKSAKLENWIVEKDAQYGNSKELIKSLINGTNRDCLNDKQYRFLFEIVNNKQCELDVDKWDYLQRDYPHACSFLPEKIKVDMDMNIKFDDVFLQARGSDDREHIEYRYLDLKKIYNIFAARQYFHIYFYRTPKAVCLDLILKEIIVDNEDVLIIDGMKIREIRSEDLEEFLQLHDDGICSALKKLNHHLVSPLLKLDIEEIKPSTDEEKAKIPHYLKVTNKLKYPKNVMKIYKMFFYGNELEKPEFEMEEGTYESINYFQIKT